MTPGIREHLPGFFLENKKRRNADCRKLETVPEPDPCKIA